MIKTKPKSFTSRQSKLIDTIDARDYAFNVFNEQLDLLRFIFSASGRTNETAWIVSRLMSTWGELWNYLISVYERTNKLPYFYPEIPPEVLPLVFQGRFMMPQYQIITTTNIEDKIQLRHLGPSYVVLAMRGCSENAVIQNYPTATEVLGKIRINNWPFYTNIISAHGSITQDGKPVRLRLIAPQTIVIEPDVDDGHYQEFLVHGRVGIGSTKPKMAEYST